MRTILACMLSGALVAGCATITAPGNAGATTHTLFDRVQMQLPSDLRRVPAQGIDGQVAHFEGAGVHVGVAFGSEVAPLQPDSVERRAARLGSGQTVDVGRVSNRMEGYPHGIWIVQKGGVAQDTRLSNPPRLGIYIHCKAFADCERVSESVLSTVRLQLEPSNAMPRAAKWKEISEISLTQISFHNPLQ